MDNLNPFRKTTGLGLIAGATNMAFNTYERSFKNNNIYSFLNTLYSICVVETRYVSSNEAYILDDCSEEKGHLLIFRTNHGRK